MADDLIERLRADIAHDTALGLRSKLHEDVCALLEALASKDAALSEIRAELNAAKHELSCCDDIPLDQGLVVGISSLQADREYLRAQLEMARKALAEIKIGYGPNHMSKYARNVAARALAEETK